MALRFWNGYSWRRISDAEARFRRARGDEVVEGDVPERSPTAAPAALPVIPLESLPEVRPAVADNVVVGESKPIAVIAPELSDEDLERLTAPDGK